MLKISVITASFNRAELIEETINSILAQNYENFEHLIVDAGSTDNTPDVLKKYPHLKIISEPDQGIYDAWNKGISLADGDIITIINSDDLIGDNVFEEVNRVFQSNHNLDIVSGNALQFTEHQNQWDILASYKEPNDDVLKLKNLRALGPFINARFFRKSLLNKVGKFSLDYRICSDIEFMIRIALIEPSIHYLNKFTYFYRSHLGSLSMNLEKTNIMEAYKDKIDCFDKINQIIITPENKKAINQFYYQANIIGLKDFLKRGDLLQILYYSHNILQKLLI